MYHCNNFQEASLIFILAQRFCVTWKAHHERNITFTTPCKLYIDGILAGEYFSRSHRIRPNESLFTNNRTLFAFYIRSEERTPSCSMRGPSAASLHRYIRSQLLKFPFLVQDQSGQTSIPEQISSILTFLAGKRNRNLTH